MLHITSLPSSNGIGDMGPEAYRFVDFLFDSGQRYWQVLPLNPPSHGEGNSPYSSCSAFAGNTLLISPELLIRDHFIDQQDAPVTAVYSEGRVDFGSAIEYKSAIFDRACDRFLAGGRNDAFEKFCRAASYWLDDYALYMALNAHFGESSWSDWPADIRDRLPSALEKYGQQLTSDIEKEKFLQYLFHLQWNEIKSYANNKGIRIIGDIPIYMSYQSADTWAHPELFKLNDDKKPSFVSGVPPDYFSSTGQLWGNPVYNWEKLQQTQFDWWLKRVEHNLELYDILRIDHFRGLVAYWQIPAGEKTAIDGSWVSAPGMELFARLRRDRASLPIIAEDLGMITPDVREFIGNLNFPGMKVLLFAFGESLPENLYAPHNHVKNCVVYTGTHDNNTIRGWYENEASEIEKMSLRSYCGQEVTAENVHDILMRLAMMSVADSVIVPMQDILGLGAECRMNIPSTTGGNWEWQLRPGAITPELARRLRAMTHIYGRLPEEH